MIDTDLTIGWSCIEPLYDTAVARFSDSYCIFGTWIGYEISFGVFSMIDTDLRIGWSCIEPLYDTMSGVCYLDHQAEGREAVDDTLVLGVVVFV